MREIAPWVIAGAALFASASVQASEARWVFEWQGGGGYEMRGVMSYDALAISGSVVREADVTCFAIEGFKEGASIGAWSLGQLDGLTTWRLHFLPNPGAFVVHGFGINLPQEWNMNGFGTDCGAQGFGFNIGNAAQDICLNGALIVDSQVDPTRHFPAVRDDTAVIPEGACLGPMMLSEARVTERD